MPFGPEKSTEGRATRTSGVEHDRVHIALQLFHAFADELGRHLAEKFLARKGRSRSLDLPQLLVEFLEVREPSADAAHGEGGLDVHDVDSVGGRLGPVRLGLGEDDADSRLSVVAFKVGRVQEP
eukprot:765168-Hanusia_phi.AAC.1